MKKSILIWITLLLIVFAVVPGAASACYLVSLTLTPDTGPVGTNVHVQGEGAPPDTPFTIVWDGTTTVASGTSVLGGGSSSYFNVPSGAAVGGHNVTYQHGQAVQCMATFTVTAPDTATSPDTVGVGTDAYLAVESLTSLPATGITAMLAVAGLAALGSGALFLRKQT